MARRRFGGAAADWTFVTATADGVSGLAQLAPGVEVTFWNSETGGSQYTDLLDIDENPVTSVVSSDGGDGRAPGTIPPFFGPDDDATTYMWADGGGPRVLLVAWDLGDLVQAVMSQAQAAEQAVDDISGDVAVLKTQGLVVLVDTGSGYPPKPPGFARAIRIGPNPPVGGVVEGDIWFQPEQS